MLATAAAVDSSAAFLVPLIATMQLASSAGPEVLLRARSLPSRASVASLARRRLHLQLGTGLQVAVTALAAGRHLYRRRSHRCRRPALPAAVTNPCRVERIAIVGGTHGNELSGVCLVRSWLQESPFGRFPSLQVETLIGNPRAVELCRRYVDFDLNRAFSKRLLEDYSAAQKSNRWCEASDSAAYEGKRAHEINAQIGPRFGASASDLCIDLHNTTSNFGDGIIINNITDTAPENHHWKMQLCAHLAFSRPLAHVICDNGGDLAEEPFLPLVAKTDLTFEVGPQAHGTIVAEVVNRQRSLVFDTLAFIERFNSGSLSAQERCAKTLQVFMLDGSVEYPRRPDGELAAFIAPQLQGRDFQVLRKGDPIFQDADSGELTLWEREDCYPMFINEAAYLEQNVAFCITRRLEIQVPELLCDESGCEVALPIV